MTQKIGFLQTAVLNERQNTHKQNNRSKTVVVAYHTEKASQFEQRWNGEWSKIRDTLSRGHMVAEELTLMGSVHRLLSIGR